jgi:hypothetical protein
MTEAPRVAYRSRTDATREGEANALGAIYRFVLDCHAKRNAAGVTSTNGDDAKERYQSDSSAERIIPD